jgi:hypothetical protein
MEYVAPPGLGILMESSGYKDSAPDGAENSQPFKAGCCCKNLIDDIVRCDYQFQSWLFFHYFQSDRRNFEEKCLTFINIIISPIHFVFR